MKGSHSEKVIWEVFWNVKASSLCVDHREVSAGVLSTREAETNLDYIRRPCQTGKYYLVRFLPPSTNATQFYFMELRQASDSVCA